MSEKSNLIVNYLPTSYSEFNLRELFSPYGNIQSVKIVRDKSTGISMGFGFVNFTNNEEAEDAVQKLNGIQLGDAKKMKVSVARPAWKANIHSNLYVSGLPLVYTKQDIKKLLGEHAEQIENLRLLTDYRGAFRGVAVIRFDSEENAYEVMKKFQNIPLAGGSTFLQIKPWRPEFRIERVDKGVTAHIINGKAFVGQQELHDGIPSDDLPFMAPHTFWGGKGRGRACLRGKGKGKGFWGRYGHNHEGFDEGWRAYGESMNGYNTNYAPQVRVGHLASGGMLVPARTDASLSMFGYPSMANNSFPMYMPQGSAGTFQSVSSPANQGQRNLPGSHALFVFHLPPEANEATLKVLFGDYGPLDSVKVIAGKGYGFVNFQHYEDAVTAVENMNGFKIGSKFLKVEFKGNLENEGLSPSGGISRASR